MRWKTITANLLKIVGLLVEPIISLEKPKDYLEASFPIRKSLWTVTYSKPVISTSLYNFSSFSSILRSNSRSHQSIGYWRITVESYVINSDGRCKGINITGLLELTFQGGFLRERYLSREAFGFAMDVICSTRRPTIFNKLAVIILERIMTTLCVSLDMFTLVVPYLFAVWFVTLMTA